MAAALYVLERAETTFFAATQREQAVSFGRAQAELLREQKATARETLLRQHEAAHLTITRVLRNALWSARLAPFVAAARAIPIDHCMERIESAARKDCFAKAGARIRGLPEFGAVDAAVQSFMSGTTVFKVKVYDLRGLTVYSSEHVQIGEDKSDNAGWLSAALGKPASMLVHRDRFNSFDGIVENRDLLQSYVPVPGRDGAIAAVFEIYSDVTPLLGQLEAVSDRMEDAASASQADVATRAEDNQSRVESQSRQHFVILWLLLLALYGSLLALVRHGQRLIDGQAAEREQAMRREHLLHRERMAALATMAAEASHNIGNPLAVITQLAEQMASSPREADDRSARRILEQAERIALMTQRIRRFASERSEVAEPLDANRMVAEVVEFMAFDDRYRATPIQHRLAHDLPACVGIPQHLHEALMSLLQAHAEAGAQGSPGRRILVRTETAEDEVIIALHCACAAPAGPCGISLGDPRLESSRRRVQGMGGRLQSTGMTTKIFLKALGT